jgi:prepilin-type N-terminal cleavage/methylation domain-containing protein/prepilin-type processing-associated H-X9-DG protein
MQSRKAFTLIELLVVIAIIAILAAILFPVFAQAKQAAKKSASLSNEKQLDLSMIMYANDADDYSPVHGLFDFANQFANPSSPQGWVRKVQPYIKSLQVTWSPTDSGPSGGYNKFGDWCGPALSYAANTLDGGGKFPDNEYHGVVGLTTNYGQGPFTRTLTSVSKPAETVLMAEKWMSGVADSTYSWLGANTADIWPTSVFMWDDASWSGPYGGQDTDIPDGTRLQSVHNGLHFGPDGDVSKYGGTKGDSQGLSNFAFVDGHCKSMKPSATNPDPVNQSDKNMWDAIR